MNNDVFLNCVMIFFAKSLKDYCDNTNCDECSFKNVDKGYGCSIATPAYWDISNTINFPNSNKQTDDGSDPFDE